MLEAASPMKQSRLGSALAGTSRLRPKGSGGRRTLITSLMLTSLVDAFSILVIFLIMNCATSSETLNTGKHIVLPQASHSELIQNGTVVRIEKGRIFVEDKPVAKSRLILALRAYATGADAKKKAGLIIVGDREMNYEELSPVILAGSQAGFSKFKFAVIRKD